MMAGDEDHRHLGLSLSLTPTTAPAPAPATPSADPQRVLNLMPVSSLPASPPPPRQQKYWNGMCFPYESKVCYEMPFLRGIDVNRAPAPAPAEKEASEDEEAGASSPNSTLSSLSGKRSLPARSGEQEAERGASPGPAAASSDNEDAADTGSRKKLRLSRDQSAILEESFKENNTLNPKKKVALAKQLNLKPRQVEVWFQNRRARTKLKQTEVDCEFLRRCCESLTEENRRLHKEVHELRALKLASPQLYMHVAPPTTLNMCPSCERVSGSDTTAAAEGSRAPLHRPTPVMGMGMAGVGPSGPWGPIPVRPMFVDGPAQRSS